MPVPEIIQWNNAVANIIRKTYLSKRPNQDEDGNADSRAPSRQHSDMTQHQLDVKSTVEINYTVESGPGFSRKGARDASPAVQSTRPPRVPTQPGQMEVALIG